MYLDFVALLLEHHIHAAVVRVLRSFWEGTSLPDVAVYGLKCFVTWNCANFFIFASIPLQQPTVLIAEGISEIYVGIILHRL